MTDAGLRSIFDQNARSQNAWRRRSAKSPAHRNLSDPAHYTVQCGISGIRICAPAASPRTAAVEIKKEWLLRRWIDFVFPRVYNNIIDGQRWAHHFINRCKKLPRTHTHTRNIYVKAHSHTHTTEYEMVAPRQ